MINKETFPSIVHMTTYLPYLSNRLAIDLDNFGTRFTWYNYIETMDMIYHRLNDDIAFPN